MNAVCARHGLHAGRRCPACAAERASRPKPATRARKLRSSARWKATAERILTRDGHRCTFGNYDEDDERGVPAGGCRARQGLDVHHRIPIEDGGDAFDEANLRTLCDHHHATTEAAYRRKKETDDGEAREF